MARPLLALLLPLLALAALAPPPAALAGGGCHMEITHTEGPATVVRMDVCAFAPTAVHVEPGAEVRFLNTSPVGHVVAGEGNTWGSGVTLAPGDEFARRFADEGVFPYSCPLHPGMVGAIVVSPVDDDAGAEAAAAAEPPSGGEGGVPALVAATVGAIAGLLAAVLAWSLLARGGARWSRA